MTPPMTAIGNTRWKAAPIVRRTNAAISANEARASHSRLFSYSDRSVLIGSTAAWLGTQQLPRSLSCAPGRVPHLITERHHVIHWTEGGVNDLANLVLLCYRHQWMVHESRWQLVKAGEGQMLTIPPTMNLFLRPAAAPGVQAA
jgi:hypothetical protein